MKSTNQLERQTYSVMPESSDISFQPLTKADSYCSSSRPAGNWRREVAVRWAVVAVWVAVILSLGTSYFSLARTAPIIDPIIRRLAPGSDPETVYNWHVLVRWSAHFSEYAVLFAALVIGPMRHRPLAALALCIACASLDEGLQALRPDRSALICDVALDSSGAATLMMLALPRWISKPV